MVQDESAWENFNQNWPRELYYWTERRADNALCRRLTTFLGETFTPAMLDDIDDVMLGSLLAWMDAETKTGNKNVS